LYAKVRQFIQFHKDASGALVGRFRPLPVVIQGNREIKEAFKTRVKEWAEKPRVEVRTVTLRAMKNKWASCSTNGNLTFDADLLALGPEEWDYVIVHELLHFFIPNHGRLWKSLMRAHLGDYEKVE
jgi:predicted metal-dependent hydrolase